MSAQILGQFTIATANATCFACRMPKRADDRVLDTGINIDFEGAIMFCETCIRYWAGLLGVPTAAQQTLMNADLAAMISEVNVARRFMASHEKAKAEVAAELAAVRRLLAVPA